MPEEPTKPPERAIIGEGPLAGLPISAPVVRGWPMIAQIPIRWRCIEGKYYVLEFRHSVTHEWLEVPLLHD